MKLIDGKKLLTAILFTLTLMSIFILTSSPIHATNLTAYRGNNYQTYTFTITGSTSGSVWGTDVYTDDSTLEAAAIHAGRLSNGVTGTVTVRILPGQGSYTGSTRYGITSSSYGAWDGSYEIISSVSFPTVVTNAATGVTDTSVTLNGNVTSSGTYSVTSRGFDGITSVGSGTGSFTYTWTGRTPNTSYSYRAYAANAGGTGYGGYQSFRTLAAVPGLTAVSHQPNGDVVLTLNRNGNPSGTEFYVQKATDSGFTANTGTALDWGTYGNSTTLTVPKAAMTPGAVNYFRVKARNANNVETAYGGQTVSAAPTYTVTYNANGSTSGSVPTDSNAYLENATVTVLGNTGNLVKTGHTFAGWNTQADGNGTDRAAVSTFTMGTENVILYAKWTVNTYTVSFNSNGGSAVGSQTVNYNAAASQPTAPTKTGYTFTGWYSDAGLTSAYNFATPVTSNITLYAKWDTASYTISFNISGGTGSTPASLTVLHGQTSAGLPNNSGITAPAGKTFAGWNTNAGGTGTNYASGATISNVISNIQLYAKWEQASLIVQYDFNGNLIDSLSGSTLTAFGPANDGNNHNNATSGFGSDAGIGGDTTYWQWTSTLSRGGGFWIDVDSDISSSYSVGVRFAYNSTNPGYKKIIDYKNKTSDNGFYFYGGGKLNYYPYGTLGLTVIKNNQIVDIIATRASNGTFTAYMVVNGTLYKELEVSDSAGHAIPVKVSGKPRLGFFFDENVTGSEATSGGKVYSVKIWNRPITQQEVKTAMNSSISYNGNGNTGGAVPTDSSEYAQGAIITVLGNTGNLVKTGYSFAGWNTAANGSGTDYPAGSTLTMGTSNIILYAKWTANSYTVTFDANGGSAVSSQTVSYNSTASQPAAPTRAGYAFGGWYSNPALTSPYNFSTSVTGNITLYAKWTSSSYIVSYSGNSNTGGSVPASSSHSYQENVTAAANSGNLVKTGYAFSGWNTSADGTGTNYAAGIDSFSMGAGNVTLYARWIPVSYTVTYDGNGNTGGTAPIDGNSYNYLSSVTSAVYDPALVRTGFKLVGWNTVADGSGIDYAFNTIFTMPAQNLTLYAKWINENYKVFYIGNENTSGTVPEDTTSYIIGDTVSTLANSENLARTGYTFAGWNTQPDGNGTNYSAGTGSFTIGAGDIALYARWIAQNYTVSYAGNGNTSGLVPTDGSTYHYQDSVTIASNGGGMARTGYSFTGWNSASDGSGIDYAPGGVMTMGAGNVTLYAKWTANIYTISYNGNGNTGGSEPAAVTTCAYQSSVTAASNSGGLERTGYAFSGWNTASDGSGTSYTEGASFVMGPENAILYTKWNPNNSSINPTTANFDKYVANQADIPVDITFNGNTLISITNGGETLVEGDDYTVAGNVYTIKKEYLALQAVGLTTLTFNLSPGNPQSLVVTISDTTTASANPVVLMGSITDVTVTDAVINGMVKDDGGGAIYERGFVLNTDAQNPPELNGAGVIKFTASSNGAGAYTVNAEGLTRGTTYYVRAFARNSIGAGYSSISTLVTPLEYDILFNVSNGNSPASGVSVEVYGGLLSNPVIINTNASGAALFRLVEGNYTYRVSKAGFVDDAGTFTVAANDITVNVAIQAACDLTFHVTGEDGNGVAGYSLWLDGVWYKTDASGDATVVMAAGTYNYTLEKSGWHRHTGTVNLSGNTTVNVSTGPKVVQYMDKVALAMTANRNGTAAASGDDLRLTSGEGQNDSGSAWLGRYFLTKGFSSYYIFNASDYNALGEDGGIALVIQNSGANVLGSPARGMGLQGINNSVSMAFDIHRSAGEQYNDTGINGITIDAASHIQINTNGILNNPGESTLRLATLKASGLSIDQAAGAGNIYVWVDYNGTNKLEVRVGRNGVRPSAPVLTYNNFTPSMLRSILGGDYGYVGFTAGSGANGINMDIKKFYLTNTYEPFDASRPKFTNPWHNSYAWASDYRETYATLNSTIEHPGTGPITERGFVYSSSVTNPKLGVNGVIAVQSGSGTGSFAKKIESLIPGTRYYFAGYAVNDAGVFYSGVNSFLASWYPTMGTNSVINITNSGADVKGSVTAAGGIQLTERGVVYSLSRNPTINRAGTTKIKYDNGAVGEFTSSLTGFAPGITYYVRTYAKNARGTSYSREISFTTMPLSVTDNTLLSYMVVQGGVLIPAYSKTLFAYSVTAPNSTSSVDMTFVPLDPAAALAMVPEDGLTVTELVTNKTYRISGLLSGTPKFVLVKVTKGSETRTYTINLVRQKSNNADLTGMNLNGGAVALTPAVFDTDTGIYTAVVDGNVSSVELLLTKADAGAVISINGEDMGDKGSAGVTQTLQLPSASNSFTITVTAEDGKNSKTYMLSIIRKLSSDAKLTNISASDGYTLSPAFSSGQHSYRVTVPDGASSVTLTPVLSDSSASISAKAALLDGTEVSVAKSGTGYSISSLSSGSTRVVFEVTAQDGVTKRLYSVLVETASTPVEEVSSNADLSSLSTSEGSLEPVFNTNQSSYSITVNNNVTSLVLTPALANPSAVLTLNGTAVSGASTVTLKQGLNTFTYRVTAEDGVTTRDYSIQVVRKTSVNAKLQSLTLSPISLSTMFDPDTADYYEYAASSVSSIVLTPVPADGSAVVQVNGVKVSDSTAVSLAQGENRIVILVTAQDGTTTKEYTLNVTRAQEGTVSLSAFSITPANPGTVTTALSPAFNSSTVSYKAGVSSDTAETAITATTADSSYSVLLKKDGVIIDDKDHVALNSGSNLITAEVTSGSGAMKVYTMNVIKDDMSGNADATLQELTVDAEGNRNLIPAFDPSVDSYLVDVPSETSAGIINAAAAGTGASITTFTLRGSSYTNGQSAALSVGSNPVVITVTAQAGNTKTYTLNIQRAAAYVTPGLSGLALSAGGQNVSLSPAFNTAIMSYNTEVSSSTGTVTVTPAKADNASTVTINGFSYSGTSGMNISLNFGTNLVKLEVTSSDGTVSTYTVSIFRPSDKADMGGVNISDGSLTPPFDGSTSSYNTTVGSSVSRITITPSVKDTTSRITINGEQAFSGQPKDVALTHGNNTISIVITALDGTVKTYTLNVYRQPSFGGKVYTVNPTVTVDNGGVEIYVNGKKQDDSAVAATVDRDGQKTTTVMVDPDKLDEKLKAEGTGSTVTIPVTNGANVVVGQLNGQMVKNMESKEAVLEIKTQNITYTLPASQINIDKVSEQIGTKVELKNIKVNVTIAEPPQDTVRIVEDTANKNNYQVVVNPVEFSITCTSRDKTIEVSKFNSYVERTVAIPEGIDPSKITTGIVLNPDGTFSHVPTIITVIDGKYYAKINSLTNSTYSVIYSPKTFKDVETHWAKDAVNDMGSRLVIDGVGDRNFEPERDITRAEFAAIVVKALGLMRPGAGKQTFDDVTKDAWYYNAVSIAYEYDIISGYGNGRFGPAEKISREQAMTMIARAMKLTGLKADSSTDEVEKLLSAFKDADKPAEYSKNGIAACVKTGVVNGKNDNLIAPKDNITRAEVAVMVRKLLQKSNLI